MTIDLGFAWMGCRRARPLVVLGPGMPGSGAPGPGAAPSAPETVGIVDAPGHLDFIKNMLAGVGGIDLCCLLSPPTKVLCRRRVLKHMAIIDLLAVPAAMVVLTRIDLVDHSGRAGLICRVGCGRVAGRHAPCRCCRSHV